MMRFIAITSTVVFSSIAAYALAADSGLAVPSVTVGRNLQVSASVRLPQRAPDSGVKLTISSDDPSRLLLSESAQKPGLASITIMVLPEYIGSRDYWLHGVGDSGTVTYTVSAEGFPTAKGTVTLVPSAIVIVGPGRIPKYPTTPRGRPSKITVVSAALDPTPKEQEIAGGLDVKVKIASSDPKIGKTEDAELTLSGGMSTAVTSFHPSALGETTLAPVQPPGFTVPTKFASVVMAVSEPGLGIGGGFFLGKDLEVGVGVALGEPAPPGGLKVTLTSSDNSKLLLSPSKDQAGSGSLTVDVPEGRSTATYFLQALSDTGDVTYEAKAAGFRGRTATVSLTPSGVIIFYAPLGPPDEKAVLRRGPDPDRRAYLSLSGADPQKNLIAGYSAYLSRDTGRGADITIQPLRPGVTATVKLTSSDPTVVTVEQSLTIKSGEARAFAAFTPHSLGTAVITAEKPPAFATPKNGLTVPMTVRQ